MNILERLRSSREWLNGGECCGDKDSEGICAAPACIFGEALKELYAAADEIEKLRAALKSVLNACDQGRMLERGAGGMTIDAQISRSFYYGVPAWPIEEARAALGEKK